MQVQKVFLKTDFEQYKIGTVFNLVDDNDAFYFVENDEGDEVPLPKEKCSIVGLLPAIVKRRKKPTQKFSFVVTFVHHQDEEQEFTHTIYTINETKAVELAKAHLETALPYHIHKNYVFSRIYKMEDLKQGVTNEEV